MKRDTPSHNLYIWAYGIVIKSAPYIIVIRVEES